MKGLIIISALSAFLFTGCAMGTPADRILPDSIPLSKYQTLKCQDLKVELELLTRSERQLAAAQESRYRASRIQAVLLGIGKGDGREASELRRVRGELEAVHQIMDRKRCRK